MIVASKQGLLNDLQDVEGRALYNIAFTRTNLAYQISELRDHREMTQTQLAKKAGTTQAQISRLESGTGSPNLQTLLDLAAALEVALYVKFMQYDRFLHLTDDVSPQSFVAARASSPEVACGIRHWAEKDPSQITQTNPQDLRWVLFWNSVGNREEGEPRIDGTKRTIEGKVSATPRNGAQNGHQNPD